MVVICKSSVKAEPLSGTSDTNDSAEKCIYLYKVLRGSSSMYTLHYMINMLELQLMHRD